ncbi:hypothetical protein FNH22_15415 [Fulvivirga sp. M361]|uniref:hypothetical protein n=1 Tax=Fulvivirga sp. M361 TaxID=2594266 RepID=UPI001179D4FA|nr:hypothetical protein [Fulvivirga sp. M361]TRX57794.1 hypothetical protein FNH22_15415 [Fulvivirga sp. M361]
MTKISHVPDAKGSALVALKSTFNNLLFQRSILLLIMFAVGVFSLLCIHDGHVWGGDFALYVSQAKAILNGTAHELYKENLFTTLHSVGVIGPYLYPYGFPVLISVLYYFVGMDFVLLKCYCTLFFILSVPLFYKLIGQSTENKLLALLVIFGVAFHPVYLQFSDSIFSEFPYLFFSLLSLISITRDNHFRGQVLTGVFIFFSFWIRDVGIFLLPALLTHQLQHQARGWKSFTLRQWLFLLCPYIIFVVLLAMNYLLLPQGGSNNIDMLSTLTWQSIFNNFDYYLSMGLYYINLHRSWGTLFPVSLLTLMGLYVVARGQASLITYFSLICLVLMCWPFFPGYRYLLPIIPFYLYFLGKGFVTVFKLSRIEKWSYVVLCMMMIAHTYIGINQTVGYFDKNSNEVYTAELRNAYAFIKANLNDSDVVAFRDPRVLRLFTGRTTIKTDLDHFEHSKADYWLAPKTAVGDISYPVVYETQNFVLLAKN